jgi:hypothetical protein
MEFELRGVSHVALVCKDMARTVDCYSIVFVSGSTHGGRRGDRAWRGRDLRPILATPAEAANREHAMKLGLTPLSLLIAGALIAGCATSPARLGQRLFAGCLDDVDDRATLESGLFVCEGDRDPAPFDGNGRACGDCHIPGDNFGISVSRIATLPDDHPFFFSGLDEDRTLLRSHGLVHVTVPGQIDEFRQTPKLVHLKTLCNEEGNCDALGLLGDRVRNLCVFSIQAITNHMARSVDRVPGEDFRVPTTEECEWLVAYMLSDLVADQDERRRK